MRALCIGPVLYITPTTIDFHVKRQISLRAISTSVIIDI
jgi:hypothetical protein